MSGGLTWIPNNEHMSEVGIDDSYEEAYGYIQRNTLGRGDDALIDLYVKEGRNVIAYLQEHASIDYGAVPHYPDYHPEFEGGRTGGRPVEGPIFDTHRLGEWAPKLRRSPIFGRSPMRVREATEWGAFSNPLGLPYKEIGRRAKAGYVCRGSALVGMTVGCFRSKHAGSSISAEFLVLSFELHVISLEAFVQYCG